MKSKFRFLLIAMLLCYSSSKAAYVNLIEIWNGKVVGTHWVEIYGTYDTNDNFIVGKGQPAISSLYAYGTVDLNNIYRYEGFGEISVKRINTKAFYGLTGITSVVIPSSVIDIGESAFRGSGIKNISIPASVKNIANSTFSRCSNLASIELADGITSIGDNAFEYCSGLSNIQIPSSVNNIGKWAFSYDTGLFSVEIPNGIFRLSEGCFAGCTGLEKIMVTPNLKAIDKYAFSDCKNLRDISFIENLTFIGDGAFKNCIGITSVIIPNGITTITKEMFAGCTGLTSITLPEGVTSIENDAFSGCLNLATIIIPSTVTKIGDNAFSNCSSLTSIAIPNNVISIGDGAFSGCNGLTSLTIPNSVTSIGSNAFSGCTELTSIAIPTSVTSIGSNAFAGCSRLSSINVPKSVTSIGSDAFSGCTALTDVSLNSNSIASETYSSSGSLKNIFGTQVKIYTLGEDVTNIGNYAFYGCSGLTDITIPSSLTSIGDWAFQGCSGLTDITIPSSVTSIGNYAFSGCSGLSYVTINSNDVVSKDYSSSSNISTIFGSQVKQYNLGDGITAIGNNAFYNCKNISSIKLPSSLTDIGYSAFAGCSSLTAITIPRNVKKISYDLFYNCEELSSIVVEAGNTLYDSREKCNAIIETASNTLLLGCKNTTFPSSIKKIGNSAFYGCTGLTRIVLPSSVTSIGLSSFQFCTGLTSINIPENVTYVGDKAFDGCNNLETAILPDKLVNITQTSFPNNTKLYVNAGCLTLLNLWNNSYSDIYETGTEKKLPAPYLTAISTTQTTITSKINNKYEGYIYEYNNRAIDDDTFVVEGLRPESSNSIVISISKDFSGITYSTSVSATTRGINPNVTVGALSASSILASGTKTLGDAKFVKEILKCNGKVVEGKNISVTGLNPNTSYNVEYTVTIAYGDKDQYTSSYTSSRLTKTNPLTLTTAQPKVVSSGNVIVSAETNVDPEETNVGFEWRRTDWSNDFASQTASAILLDGTMEGYIRNMNTDKLWKYRAYYLSDSGTYYYGDWVGIDPSNTSYFEPTVHTYANIDVNGNTALLKGYALSGTDKIKVQGFKYWKTTNASNGHDARSENRALAVSVPVDAKTETVDIVGAGQQLMNASIQNLEFETTYYYVAFVTTENNETFYGEEQTFTTGADTSGIEGVKDYNRSKEPASIVAYYDINGKKYSLPQKGLNIIRMSDGTTKKIVIK